jgi:hypothetical protein
MYICQKKARDGSLLKAVFSPEKGMNLMSLSKDGVEVIDQNTRPLFEERMAGLGSLIGPHFHHRPESEIPPLKDLDLFPFLKALKEKGQKEPFSHGIGRYVPWHFEGQDSKIEASLFSEDRYRGVKLRELEGESFELHYKAYLTDEALCIDYSFTKEKPGVIGLHYYYALFDKKGVVESQVAPQYHSSSGWQPLKKEWVKGDSALYFPLAPDIEADFGFRPREEGDLQNSIFLSTDKVKLEIHYEASSEENAWQLYHPKNATYVCLEPLSAKNPRDPKLTSGHLKIRIKIF